MANKKLFEAALGTPGSTHRFAYGKAGEASKTIEVSDLRTVIAGGTKTTVVQIGAWNMDTDTFKIIGHTVTLNKIMDMSAIIISDSGTVSSFLSVQDGTAATVPQIQASVGMLGTPIISLTRRTGSEYDATTYTTAANRGFVVITHLP